MASPNPIPKSILIVGSGVFGLSTAYSLARNPNYISTTITVLDRSPFPSPDGSSIDTSRIIRADYSDPAYASLAALAQEEWRKQGPDDLGGEGRYSESGLALVANKGEQGEDYVRHSFENVLGMMGEGDVVELGDSEKIAKEVGTGGRTGNWGYINRRSGWADAEASMRWLRRKVEGTNRVKFILGQAENLVTEGKKVTGVRLDDGSIMSTGLIVLATGAWTGKLVNLTGRAMATGLFIIPPANNVLKVARHAYGYSNPIQIPDPSGSGNMIEVSLPKTTRDDPLQWVPAEGEAACRAALAEMVPMLANRPFKQAKICWYTDTPNGDFLITYHPDYEGLFLATGGSGHGFKFLPNIGDKIVDTIDGRCPPEFKEKWAWPREQVDKVATEDGSRGGQPGMILETEFKKGSRL